MERTIPPYIRDQLDPIEAKVRAVLKHDLMTSFQLIWEFRKDGDGEPRYDMGPPSLYVRTFFKRPPDGMTALGDALEAISEKHYTELSWYYCQDEDWYDRDGGYQWFWDDESHYRPW